MTPLHHPRTQSIVQRRRQATSSPLRAEHLPQKLYQARGSLWREEGHLSLADLPDPWQLAGMGGLVDHLQAALANDQSILILGDYDADGATSTALAVLGLSAMGGRDIGFLVPNRFDSGYGMSEAVVALAAERHPDWILTVDNGISSHAGVAAAKALGIGVLITDHHLPGETLPPADAIVNPCLNTDDFPGRSLAGVGVMFFVLMALRQRLREHGWFNAERPEPKLADFLDLVALGTVADLVTLDEVNRILVRQGVQRIRQGHVRVGIAALLEVAGRDHAHLDVQDLAFAIAPRLNAAGRMQDMSIGIECLLSQEQKAAQSLASALDQINQTRKLREGEMQTEALSLLRRSENSAVPDAAGLCLYHPEWHQGIVGIIAARIKDRYARPVIAFAESGDGILRGSARSISGVHIRDTLSDISASAPDLIMTFGGHAMAAGLSIQKEKLADFKDAFAAAVAKRCDSVGVSCIESDGELAEDAFSQETAQLIRQAGPWGQGFPPPVFDGIFEVIDNRILAGKHLKMTLAPRGSKRRIEAIAFQVETPEQWMGQAQIRAAYRLEINRYQGRERLQLAIDYMETC